MRDRLTRRREEGRGEKRRKRKKKSEKWRKGEEKSGVREMEKEKE